MPFGGRVCGHVHGPAAPGVVLVSAEASGCSKVRCCSARPTLASAIRRPPGRASATSVRTCRFCFGPARCACWRATGLTHLMEGAAGRSGGDRFHHPACRARPSGRHSDQTGEAGLRSVAFRAAAETPERAWEGFGWTAGARQNPARLCGQAGPPRPVPGGSADDRAREPEGCNGCRRGWMQTSTDGIKPPRQRGGSKPAPVQGRHRAPQGADPLAPPL